MITKIISGIIATIIIINYYLVPPPTTTPPLVVNIIGCDRASQFNLALLSLANAYEKKTILADVIIYASVDCNHQETIDMVLSWEKSASLPVVYVESFQMKTIEHSNKMDERVARHWLSSNNRLFDMGYDNVIYLESDHVVTTDFFDAAAALIAFTDDYCPTCFMSNVGCHGDCHGNNNPLSSNMNELAIYPLQNIGVIYRRYGWERFIANIHLFCDILGDWDINMNTILTSGDIPDVDPRSPGYTIPRVFHTTTCYTSRRKSVLKECNSEYHEKEYLNFIRQHDAAAVAPPLPLVMTNSISRGVISKRWSADDATRELCNRAIFI